MSLNKAIAHGKEKRKPYSGGKAVFRRCRNHGGCGFCEGNRLYQTMKEMERMEDAEKDDYGESDSCCFPCGAVDRNKTLRGVEMMQKPINFDQIWLEDRDKEEVIPAVLCEFCEPGVFEFGVTDGSPVAVIACPCLSDYGSRWRAWAHKPTDEERKAAEWKD